MILFEYLKAFASAGAFFCVTGCGNAIMLLLRRTLVL